MQFWYCQFLEVKEMGSQWKEGKLIQLFLRFSWLVVIDMIRCTCRETCCQVCVFTDCLFLYRRRLNRVSICRTHFAKLGHGGRKLFINYSHNHSTWCTVWNELLREKAEVVSWVSLSSFDIAYQFPWGLKWAAKERSVNVVAAMVHVCKLCFRYLNSSTTRANKSLVGLSNVT